MCAGAYRACCCVIGSAQPLRLKDYGICSSPDLTRSPLFVVLHRTWKLQWVGGASRDIILVLWAWSNVHAAMVVLKRPPYREQAWFLHGDDSRKLRACVRRFLIMPDTRCISWRTSVLALSLFGLLKLCQITYSVRSMIFSWHLCTLSELSQHGKVFNNNLLCFIQLYTSFLPVSGVFRVWLTFHNCIVCMCVCICLCVYRYIFLS